MEGLARDTQAELDAFTTMEGLDMQLRVMQAAHAAAQAAHAAAQAAPAAALANLNETVAECEAAARHHA
jgi:hypothetical protein